MGGSKAWNNVGRVVAGVATGGLTEVVNAAKGGYVDNIIEPAFVRQYLIASLQMLIK